MDFAASDPASIRLSICITTFNRAALIAATLDSICSQLTSRCELVVLDGGSTDGTESVIEEYTRRFDNFRYVRQGSNCGFDQDCDRAVELAEGEYCWLMTDDDLLRPGAVELVLQALRQDWSLVVVNTEARSFDMSRLLQSRALDFESNRTYKPGEADRMFTELGSLLCYVGCIVIKRTVWLARERRRYYGSWFVYVGVIFQKRLPGDTLVIASPLVSYRSSNSHSWSSKIPEINFDLWPSLIESLPISDYAKSKVPSVQPWRNPGWLLVLRGAGFYSLADYRRWISHRPMSFLHSFTSILVALVPGTIANVLFLLYYSTREDRGGQLQWMRDSRFYLGNWTIFKAKRAPAIS